MKRLVILDRDGVINYDSAKFIKTPTEWKPLPGSLDAIARLNQAGFSVVVATNQSGVARGLFDMATLNSINDKMLDMVFQAGGRIDAVFYCPHAAEQECACRKPNSGMFLEIAQRYNVSLGGVPAVGDSLRDLQAADAVGAQPMLVLTGKGEKTNKNNELPEGTLIFADLTEAVKHIIADAS
jgi:D-glycero-D-manno-heptose 1,7-bisphosphate phosphatase